MTHFSDDLYTGGPSGGPDAFTLFSTTNTNQTGGPLPSGSLQAPSPTRQQGVGPLGRIVFRTITPLALSAVNLALAQAPTANVPLVLTAGAGITTTLAPDGSGATALQLDCSRCLSLTSTANLSGITFLFTGYDEYMQKQTQLLTGPNANTVTTKKGFAWLLSCVPQGSSASTVSAGTSDIFGLQFKMIDAGYIISAKWANVMAQNGGTFVAADSTSPATNLTGDTRGTFAPSGAASNGANILVIAMHVNGSQCGAAALPTNAIGVLPA